MKTQKVHWKPLSFLRMLLGALKCGSWQLSKEIEADRVLFPNLYELMKKKEAKQEKDMESWFKRALRQQKEAKRKV